MPLVPPPPPPPVPPLGGNWPVAPTPPTTTSSVLEGVTAKRPETMAPRPPFAEPPPAPSPPLAPAAMIVTEQMTAGTGKAAHPGAVNRLLNGAAPAGPA